MVERHFHRLVEGPMTSDEMDLHGISWRYPVVQFYLRDHQDPKNTQMDDNLWMKEKLNTKQTPRHVERLLGTESTGTTM